MNSQVYDRLSRQLRRILDDAQMLAKSRGHSQVACVHWMAVIVDDLESGVESGAARILHDLGIGAEEIHSALRDLLGPLDSQETTGIHPTLTMREMRVLRQGANFSFLRGAEAVQSYDVLFAMAWLDAIPSLNLFRERFEDIEDRVRRMKWREELDRMPYERVCQATPAASRIASSAFASASMRHGRTDSLDILVSVFATGGLAAEFLRASGISDADLARHISQVDAAYDVRKERAPRRVSGATFFDPSEELNIDL